MLDLLESTVNKNVVLADEAVIISGAKCIDKKTCLVWKMMVMEVLLSNSGNDGRVV